MANIYKRRAGGRVPAQETDAARLLIKVFGTFRQAGRSLKVSRQAAQAWGANGAIPEGRLEDMSEKYRDAVISAKMIQVFNRLGRPYAITITTTKS